MKPTVLISKIGSVFKTRELAAQSSNVGEQGETEGIVNHLLTRDDIQLVYFGQWRGKIPEKMKYVESYIGSLNDLSTSREQKERWIVDTVNVKELQPRIFINIAGYASTVSRIDNPAGAAIQAAAIRYVAPVLNVLHSCELPRVVINNDPRSYPRESEMAWDWGHVRPIALLSQRTANWSRKIRSKKYEVREVYSGAENWCEYTRLKAKKMMPVTVIAHAHIADGCRFRARDDAWANVLAPEEDIRALYVMGMRVYGKGWEHFRYYDQLLMPGVINPANVMKILSESMTCPAVAAGNNFYTGKLRTCLAQRCLPLFYGDGQPHTFDPLGKYISLASEMRIVRPGDLLKTVKYFERNTSVRNGLIDALWASSRPDFTLLDECIDDLLKGRDTNSESWWQKYGGYRETT